MKTKKEIQLATLTFSRAFKTQKASSLEGVYIPFNPSYLYKEHQFYLGSSITFGVLFTYLAYHAWFTDAVYYWHIDGPVIIGISIIVLFLVCFLFLFNKYLEIGNHLKTILETPDESPYGIIITDEYYFENTPKEFHIIPKENIVRIDHEETIKEHEVYVELLLDMGDHYELRGVTYNESQFDFKAWVKEK